MAKDKAKQTIEILDDLEKDGPKKKKKKKKEEKEEEPYDEEDLDVIVPVSVG